MVPPATGLIPPEVIVVSTVIDEPDCMSAHTDIGLYKIPIGLLHRSQGHYL
jgi:hypothetical protein